MSRDPMPAESSFAGVLRTFRQPLPLMGAAFVCTAIGLVLMQTSLVPLRAMFLGMGLLLAAIAVGRRLQTAGGEMVERMESAGLLGASFCVVLLAYQGVDPSWDSAYLFLHALMIVSLGAAVLVLLPTRGRRIAVLALVLFHFGGIFTAVSSVPPRNDPPPWISAVAWLKFYRHYLFFTYFTNAYHFYSPDPGPASLLRFYIEYADGTTQWEMVPNRHKSPVNLHHQRMLALAESALNPPIQPIMDRSVIDEWENKLKPRKYELLPGIPHASGTEIFERRRQAIDTYKFVDPNDGRPATPLFVVDLAGIWNAQYAEPTDYARRLIASIARHVAHAHSTPSTPVKAVRVYRVVHKTMLPRELNAGKEPLDPTNFQAFYMGKYDPDGTLLDPEEPFLFWHLPIIRVSKRYPEPGTFLPPEKGGPMLFPIWPRDARDDSGKILDFLEIHATQSERFYKQTAKK